MLHKLIFLNLVICCFGNFINAGEKEISLSWCSSMNGKQEYRTHYGTYADCLTDEYAIEVEFDYKWKESIGQAIHYAEATNKKPAIALILRKKSRVDYLTQINNTLKYQNLDIPIFIINE